MEATRQRPGGQVPVRVRDIPIVFLSYDEPWAERNWQDLVSMIPTALRVNGVEGLDACHKAAAEAAGTEWFITVDADTTVMPEFVELELPEWLFEPTLRPTWYSRNAVNGLVSGNGSLKLWPAEIVARMRSHEEAPDGTISIDHDIEAIEEGRTRRVQMPGCYSITDPARTAYHAFRAGLRECVYLAHILEAFLKEGRQGDERTAMLHRVISTWCTLGRHHPNGAWMMLGARMGARSVLEQTGWDIRKVNSYDWLEHFWNRNIHARFGAPGTTGLELKGRWNPRLLDAELRGQGVWLRDHSDLDIAELGPSESRLIVESDVMPAVRSANAVDSIARGFQTGVGVPQDGAVARTLFEEAAAMFHPSAFCNLGELWESDSAGSPDLERAEWFYAAATTLGNAFAPYRLARLIRAQGDLSTEEAARVRDLEKMGAERRGMPQHDPAAGGRT